MRKIEEIVRQIQPLDKEKMKQAVAHNKKLAIPTWSLGELHNLSVKVAGIQKKFPLRAQNKVVATMAGDHQVVREKVSLFPPEVTRQMVYNFLRGEASINVLAQHCGVKVVVVDLGVAAKIKPLPASKYPFVDRKIRLGAKNIARGPAMSRKSALLSIKAGIEVFEQQYQQGVDLAGTGEMGIGNTTPSAAIASVIIDSSPEAVTGRGTGLSPAAWQEKVKVVSRAIKINRPDPQDPLDVLAKIGGLEIGGLVGWILAGAAYNVPMVIDGFISTAAALLAVKFSPEVKNYLIAAHQSKEKGHKLMLKYLKLKPLLNLQMRLGEGTGAALGMFIIEAAIKIFHQVATFQQAQVTPGRLE